MIHKEEHKLKTSSLVKNPHFSSNSTDIRAKLHTHEVVIWPSFIKIEKNIDILLRQKFLACALFYASPFNSSSCIFFQVPRWKDRVFKAAPIKLTKVQLLSFHATVVRPRGQSNRDWADNVRQIHRWARGIIFFM